jgi:hypothetical protein
MIEDCERRLPTAIDRQSSIAIIDLQLAIE